MSFTCADPKGANDTDGSGVVACETSKTSTGEGPDVAVTAVATDAAGNPGTGTVAGLKIDLTAPTITGATSDAPDGTNGWYRSPVTVQFTVADGGSGLDPLTVPADVTFGEGDGHLHGERVV